MKKVVFVLSVLCTSLLLGNPASQNQDERAKKINQFFQKKHGGFVINNSVQKGKVVLGNAQNLLDSHEVENWARNLISTFKIKVEIKKVSDVTCQNAQKIGDHFNAEAILFIISDKDLPTLITAPESHWVIVNVLPLKKDADRELFISRCKKEISRGFGFLAGAHGSRFQKSLMGPISTPKELDGIQTEQLPADVIARFPSYLYSIGITPYKRTTYRQACMQGWAPAPTNSYQKAIWEEFHKSQPKK